MFGRSRTVSTNHARTTHGTRKVDVICTERAVMLRTATEPHTLAVAALCDTPV